MSKKLTQEEYIEKVRFIHNNSYDYSKTIYTGNKNKLIITCIKHGDFEQNAASHYKCGCPKCSLIKNSVNRKLDINELINRFVSKHGDKYDYSKVIYIKKQSKIIITCKKHNEEFLQTPEKHLDSITGGCPKCNSIGKGNLTLERFLEKAFNIHKDKYDYSQTKIVNCTQKIKINCKEHGIFEQIPNKHLRGYGCSNCNKSKGNYRIKSLLQDRNIMFVEEKKFNECKNKNHLPFDFYLPKYNICIEFDGEQHFKPKDYFGGIDGFEKRKINDNIKNSYCLNNNINLIRIPYYDFDKIEKIIEEICQ